MIFLRLLAGGSYLDLIWYGVQLDSVRYIFKSMLSLFKKAYPAKEVMNFNPSSPDFQTKILPDIARDWSKCSRQKFIGFDLLSGGRPGGTILAVDGFVQPILPPSEKDLRGMNRKHFWNRKGFMGLSCQSGSLRRSCSHNRL